MAEKALSEDLAEDAEKLIAGHPELLSGDELARLAFLISMGTVGAFIVVAFVFIIL